MRVFLTGATGFIGLAVIPELIGAGHQVLGLTRSDAGAQALIAAGAEPHRGHLEDLDSLRSGAAKSDAVIHCAFIHDFSRFQENSEIDRLAIEAIGAVLAGSDRPFIVTSGVPFLFGGDMTEDTDCPANSPTPRVSEPTAMGLLSQGVSAAVMRLPQVHDTEKQGLVSPLIEIAREKGVSAYVGDGQNGWPAAHISDTARLYRLALDQHKAGARWHAIGEDSVRLKDIAEAIGRGLKVPVVSLSLDEAPAHFGFFGGFAGVDLSASSVLTQQRLGWRPAGPGMIEDLDNMQYSPA
jgi:nucleoside-diphosphate-sugar epimerase